MNLMKAFSNSNDYDDRLFAPAISKYKNKLIETNQRDSVFTAIEDPQFGVKSIINQKIFSKFLKHSKFGLIVFIFITIGLLNSFYNLAHQHENINCPQIINLIKMINGFYSIILVYIFLIRDNYINQLTTIWKTLDFAKYKLCYRYFYTNRKKYHLALYAVYGIITVENIYNTYNSPQSFFGQSYLDRPTINLTISVIYFIDGFMVDLISLSQDLILIDTCYLAYSALYFIKANLGQFNQETINRSIVSYYRKKYTLACDFIISANCYSKYYIFALYTSNMIILITRIYFTFFVSNTIRYVLIASTFHLNHLIGISLITYLVTKTHSLTHQVQDELYPITFKTQQIPSLYEVMLFMYRVGRKDVGFTFGNLFVMTPNFISSLITISATLIIAIPSFLPYYKVKGNQTN